MGILSNYFPMGLGTARLPITGSNDASGIEKSAQLICDALDAGVNYIDTSYPYSAGGAHPALKLAFERTSKPYSVTVKVIYQSDKTADEARRRVEMQLETLGIDRAAFFVCWSIPSYEQFVEITQKGGVYDAALRLKNEGLIEHICCSLHASTADSVRIIESGAFEAATVSFNFTNAIQTLPVLDAALKHNVDIAVMNPLGGGGIVQNADIFSFTQAKGENVVTAALRFAKSHPAIKIVLSGVNNENELKENIKAFIEESTEPDAKRLIRVTNKVKDIDGFCVNCHYCDNCPVEIPVSELMSKYNCLLFGHTTGQDYRRTNIELLQNINLFFSQSHLEGNKEWFPVSAENPCIRCGQCEEKCTQKLKITESIENMYIRAGKCGFSRRLREERLRELIFDKAYKRVGLYPNDRFANLVIKLYEQFFGKPDFEWVTFNSDSAMVGRVENGIKVHAPSEILTIKPNIIIVCNYGYEEEIHNSIKHYEKDGIKTVKLHRRTDVPWVF